MYNLPSSIVFCINAVEEEHLELEENHKTVRPRTLDHGLKK